MTRGFYGFCLLLDGGCCSEGASYIAGAGLFCLQIRMKIKN